MVVGGAQRIGNGHAAPGVAAGLQMGRDRQHHRPAFVNCCADCWRVSHPAPPVCVVEVDITVPWLIVSIIAQLVIIIL
jgi:hypothetical protein